MEHRVTIFSEEWRILKDAGSLWVVIGVSFAHMDYCNIKAKNLVGIPWQAGSRATTHVGLCLYVQQSSEQADFSDS